jgi:hypothetical protein
MSKSIWLEVWGPLGTFAGTCALWHWLFVYGWGLRYAGWRALDALAWKRLDYAFLAVTGLSLLFVVADSRRVFADHDWRLNFARLSSAQSQLSDALTSFTKLVCGLSLRRTEYSPPNFDDLVAQQKLECDDTTRLKEQVGTILQAQDRAKLYSVGPPSKVTEPGLRGDYDWLIAAHKELVTAEALNAELYARAQRNLTGELLRLLSIYILAAALALRITKNTADIKAHKLSALDTHAEADAEPK